MVCVYGRAKEQCNDHIDASCLHILNNTCSSLKEAFWIFLDGVQCHENGLVTIAGRGVRRGIIRCA